MTGNNRKPKAVLKTSAPSKKASSNKKKSSKNARPSFKNEISTLSLNGSNKILKLITQSAPMKKLFNALASDLEHTIPQATCAFFSYDSKSKSLQLVSAPSLAVSSQKKIKNLHAELELSDIDQKVLHEDIKQTSFWKTIKETLEFKSFLFIPIEESAGKVAGILSLFFSKTKAPSTKEKELIQSAAMLASIAFERQRETLSVKKIKIRFSEEAEERTQKMTEAIRQLQDEIVQRKKIERSLKTSNETLQNLSNHLENVREEERTRISREIHDELGQMLTTIKMKLSILEERILEEKIPIQDDLQAMMGLVETTLQTVRRISTELRPGILDVLGLSEALEWQAQEFEERTQIKIMTNIQRLPEKTGKDVATAFFRICQEALTNVARHAQAEQVTVSLKHKQGKLSLIVQDDGKGITNEQLSGLTSLGLIGMRERAQNLGGDLKIQRAPHVGTLVSFSTPLEL